MTLTTRLLVFSLLTLGLVLGGFSAALLLAAREYLRRQADDRLAAAANVLVAACEVKPGGVDWEPHERTLAFGEGAAGDRVAWRVTDDRGGPVDGSAGDGDDDLLSDAAAHLTGTGRPTGRVEWQGERWLVRREWVAAPTPAARGHRPKGGRGPSSHPALAVTVGVPLGPARDALWRLGGVLAGLSAAVWLVALVTGRAVCRRALRPLTRMAAAARAMPAAAPGGRLPVPPTGDEVGDLGAAFNGLLDRLEEAAERQRRFAGEASHQLRTPLAAMLGQAEVALRRDRSPEEYRRTLGAVVAQAGHLRRLIEALLFLARPAADAGPLAREPVALAAWLPEQLAAWADHPRLGDLRFEPPDREGGPAWAAVHPVLFGELVTNLVDNALKFSRPGDPVTVRAGVAGEQAFAEVEDRGCGVDPADRPHLFRPFFRSAAARRHGVPGTGLGLAIVRRVAEAHGGAVEVYPGSAGGTRVRVTLPRAHPPTAPSCEEGVGPAAGREAGRDG